MAALSVQESWQEKMKRSVAPRLYHWFRAQRELRRGEAEIGLLPYLVDAKRNAVDIGANKGVYTYWLATLAQHVYAYEPNPKVFAVLNAGTKGDAKVTAQNVALSDSAGEATLHIPIGKRGLSNQGGSLAKIPSDKDMFTATVPARRLDDEGLRDIGFIKIDVEGFEHQVLAGARDTILRDRPVLLIEMEQRHTGIPILEAVDRVCALGYDAFALIGGVLRDVAFLDVERQHTACPDPRDYVNNFIFLPRKRTD